MAFKPIGKRVLIEQMVEPEKQGGIIVIERASKNEGTIIALADDCTEVKVGDHVMVERNYNTLIKVDGRMCWLLKQEDIVAVITK